MKRNSKEKYLEKGRSIFRGIIYSVLYMCILLFVTVTGVTVLPIIHGHNPEAATAYAYIILVVNMFIVYKWLEILFTEGDKFK